MCLTGVRVRYWRGGGAGVEREAGAQAASYYKPGGNGCDTDYRRLHKLHCCHGLQLQKRSTAVTAIACCIRHESFYARLDHRTIENNRCWLCCCCCARPIWLRYCSTGIGSPAAALRHVQPCFQCIAMADYLQYTPCKPESTTAAAIHTMHQCMWLCMC